MASPSHPVDERGSLKHVLDETPTTEMEGSQENYQSDATIPAHPSLKPEDSNDHRPQSKSTTPRKTSPSKTADVETPGGDGNTPQYTANPTTTRRNANGSVSSVYSGNKIRHLKKDDGVPLWRKDIQYDFLKTVFEDEQRVFHKMSDGTPGHTFADIYLDAMAKSSKCSRILKDKLLSDRPAGVNMAMVCLLVNVGRMNTTLNCKLPECMMSMQFANDNKSSLR
jgi:Ino eighty subunit 1